MSSDLKTYGIQLNEDQIVELEKLAAIGYKPEDIAVFFDIDKSTVVTAANDKDSLIAYHIKRGKLISKAKEGMSVLSSSEGGNITAAQQMMKLRRLREFKDSRKHFIYDDENTYHKLEAYIESGCTANLSDDEELYIEVLTMMNSMRRKYGKKNTIAFFTKSPFEFSRHRAKSLFEKSIQYFYADSSIEKKALRNLRAEMIMEAAQVVLDNASSAKDYEVYSNMIVQASKLQQLDQPDPPEIPKGLYDRFVKIYELDPEAIGMEKVNRLELAKQIDELDVPEKVKQRAKQDANIIDINFEEIVDELEKEGQEKK